MNSTKEKLLLSISLTFAGISIVSKDLHQAKASESIVLRLSDKVIFFRLEHQPNASTPILATVLGSTIEVTFSHQLKA